MSNIETDIACLAPSGVVAAYATEDPAARLSMPMLSTMFGGYAFRLVFFYSIPEAALRLAVREVSACVASCAYVPTVGKILALDVSPRHMRLRSPAQ